MKHVKKFEGFKNNKPEVKIEDKVNETVFQVENTYRVNVIVDIEDKFLSAYAKKVKQNMNKDILDLMGKAMLAEEIVKWVIKDGLDVEKIPASAIIGGAQGQGQAQGQPAAQEPAAQEPAAQGQPAQGQPAQGQPAQGQPAQGQPAAQGQPGIQVQTQTTAQPAQSQAGGEELPV